MIHVIGDEAYLRMRDNENRLITLQDRVGTLESQVELLKEQLEKSRLAETQSYQKVANICFQMQYGKKLFPEVDGLPESQIKEEDMRPLANQHSYMNALHTAKQQEQADINSYFEKVNARLAFIQKQREAEAQRKAAQMQEQQAATPDQKKLDELAQESFAR